MAEELFGSPEPGAEPEEKAFFSFWTTFNLSPGHQVASQLHRHIQAGSWVTEIGKEACRVMLLLKICQNTTWVIAELITKFTLE